MVVCLYSGCFLLSCLVKQSNKPRRGLGNSFENFIALLFICYGDCIIKSYLLTYLHTIVLSMYQNNPWLLIPCVTPTKLAELNGNIFSNHPHT